MTVTKDDIEAKAGEIILAVDRTRGSARSAAMTGGMAVAVAVATAFILGRRRGSRKKTLVEVYRV